MSSARKISRLGLAVFMLVTCVGCDQITKQMALETLRDASPIVLLGEILQLRYAENTGAFLGLGQSLSPVWRFRLLTGIAAVLLMALICFLVAKWDMSKVRFTALILIVAGGIGNLLDRVFREGVVIDFMMLDVGLIRTGIFNVADVAITSGVIILIIESLHSSTETRAST